MIIRSIWVISYKQEKQILADLSRVKIIKRKLSSTQYCRKPREPDLRIGKNKGRLLLALLLLKKGAAPQTTSSIPCQELSQPLPHCLLVKISGGWFWLAVPRSYAWALAVTEPGKWLTFSSLQEEGSISHIQLNRERGFKYGQYPPHICSDKQPEYRRLFTLTLLTMGTKVKNFEWITINWGPNKFYLQLLWHGFCVSFLLYFSGLFIWKTIKIQRRLYVIFLYCLNAKER